MTMGRPSERPHLSTASSCARSWGVSTPRPGPTTRAVSRAFLSASSSAGVSPCRALQAERWHGALGERWF
jgi:hypothetical protein